MSTLKCMFWYFFSFEKIQKLLECKVSKCPNRRKSYAKADFIHNGCFCVQVYFRLTKWKCLLMRIFSSPSSSLLVKSIRLFPSWSSSSSCKHGFNETTSSEWKSYKSFSSLTCRSSRLLEEPAEELIVLVSLWLFLFLSASINDTSPMDRWGMMGSGFEDRIITWGERKMKFLISIFLNWI